MNRTERGIIAFALILLMAFGVSLFAGADNPYPTTQDLGFAQSSCEGTAVGPQTLLTATHCFVEGGPLQSINGYPVKVRAVTSDGHDHTLVLVDGHFPKWAHLDVTAGLRQGDRVRYWGAPNGHYNFYREGYLAGTCLAPKECLDHTKVKGVDLTGKLYVLLTPGWGGDSGAGVFDDKGNVVAMVSARDTFAPALPVTIAVPFHFTADQLKEIQ